MDDVKRVGLLYLALAIPALYGIYLVAQEQQMWQYGVFLGIFIGFLAMEALYDFILKLSFRNNWKLLVPYGFLYIAMNYGFIVMVWKYYSQAFGVLMLGLAILQIGINIWASHPKILRKIPILRDIS
jgi:hypothetical protein